MKVGAEDRVLPSLMASDLKLDGAWLTGSNVEYADDVVSVVCGHQSGQDIYASRDGQSRRWKGSGVDVTQLAGIFGLVNANEAIAQVQSALNCTSYRDRDGAYEFLYQIAVPKFDKVDGSLMFCERVNGAQYICTILLTREDILTKIQVVVGDESKAKQMSSILAEVAARQISQAW